MGVLPLTGIVVTFNEERRLEACLRSLAFCEQVIVADLGSSDRSVAIAAACGVERCSLPRVQVAEQVLPDLVPAARHDWVLRLDPDEVVPDPLVDGLRRTLAEAGDDVAGIQVPYHYYFRGQRLDTTVWGAQSRKDGWS